MFTEMGGKQGPVYKKLPVFSNWRQNIYGVSIDHKESNNIEINALNVLFNHNFIKNLCNCFVLIPRSKGENLEKRFQ